MAGVPRCEATSLGAFDLCHFALLKRGCASSAVDLVGDRDRGGSNLRKLEGGVKILNFQGPLKLTPFYRDSIENRQFRGQKSKFSRGNFRGEFPPPL